MPVGIAVVAKDQAALHILTVVAIVQVGQRLAIHHDRPDAAGYGAELRNQGGGESPASAGEVEGQQAAEDLLVGHGGGGVVPAVGGGDGLIHLDMQLAQLLDVRRFLGWVVESVIGIR